MIVIEGNTTAPAELEDAQGQNPRLKFTVAQNERRKNPHTGEWEDGDTTFWNVTLWGRKALNAAHVLTEKGIPVIVYGRKFKVRPYERRDGGTGFSADVTAETVGLIPRSQQPAPAQQYAQPVDGFGSAVPGRMGAGGDPWGGGGSAPF